VTKPKRLSRTPARKSPQPKPLPLKLVVGGAYVHGPSYVKGAKRPDMRTLVLLTSKPDVHGKLRFASVLSPRGGLAFPKLKADNLLKSGWRLVSMPDGTKVTQPARAKPAKAKTAREKVKHRDYKPTPADVGPDSASGLNE
jgi:hypothetical protein